MSLANEHMMMMEISKKGSEKNDFQIEFNRRLTADRQNQRDVREYK